MHRQYSNARIVSASLIADVLAVTGAYYSAVFFRFHSHAGARLVEFLNWLLRVPRFEIADGGLSLEAFYIVSAPRIITLIALTVIVIQTGMDLYAGRRLLTRCFRVGDIARANFFALMFFFVYFYMSRNQLHPRSMFALIAVFNTLYTALLRALADRFLAWQRLRAGVDRCPAVIAGERDAIEPLADWIDARHPQGVYLVERIEMDATDVKDAAIERVGRRIRESGASMLILAAPGMSMEDIMRFMSLTDQIGIPLKVLSRELDLIGRRVGLRADRVEGMPLIHFAPTPPDKGIYHRLKRGYSIVAALAGLLLLGPLMAALALAVRCGSKGPALFIQERVGRKRQVFRMYKFRTMFQDAEENLSLVEPFNESGEGLFKIRRDPRVTPVGRFLRRFSLDELPQLINVLRGDMSLVGPRPLPRRDLENYHAQWHYIRHNGLPGLTCLWQVVGRSDLDFHSMCLLDIYYLRNQTLAFDSRILARTLHAVVFARGAY